jgi:transposase
LCKRGILAHRSPHEEHETSEQAHAGQRGEEVRDIRRASRRHHSAEEKIRIVLEGLRGEVSVATSILSLVEGVSGGEAGKKRLAGDTAREATSYDRAEGRRPCWRSNGGLAEIVESICRIV